MSVPSAAAPSSADGIARPAVAERVGRVGVAGEEDRAGARPTGRQRSPSVVDPGGDRPDRCQTGSSGRRLARCRSSGWWRPIQTTTPAPTAMSTSPSAWGASDAVPAAAWSSAVTSALPTRMEVTSRARARASAVIHVPT